MVSEGGEKEPKVVHTVPTVIAGSAAVEDVSRRPSVRFVYFRPKDYPVRKGVVESLHMLIVEANRYYADEMQRHGFGRKTFAVETDSNGVPVVHSIVGRFEEGYYRHNEEHSRGVYKAREEILDEHYPDEPQHIYVCVMDMTREAFVKSPTETSCAFGGLHYVDKMTRNREILGGYVVIPASGACSESLQIMMHELGHAFGLYHDFREGIGSDLIMAYGSQSRLSQDAAEWLSASAFFNDTIPDSSVGDITLLPNPKHTPQGVRVRFQVEDTDGLHQMQFLSKEETGDIVVIGFKTLNGLIDTVEFTSAKAAQNRVVVQIIDKSGGITQVRFPPIN